MLPERRLPEMVMVAVLSQPGRLRVCDPCPLITVMLTDCPDCHLAHLSWPTHLVWPVAGAAAMAGAAGAGAGGLAAAFLASSSAFFLTSSAFFSSAFFC